LSAAVREVYQAPDRVIAVESGTAFGSSASTATVTRIGDECWFEGVTQSWVTSNSLACRSGTVSTGVLGPLTVLEHVSAVTCQGSQCSFVEAAP
jgi:hypothetical protein